MPKKFLRPSFLVIPIAMLLLAACTSNDTKGTGATPWVDGGVPGAHNSGGGAGSELDAGGLAGSAVAGSAGVGGSNDSEDAGTPKNNRPEPQCTDFECELDGKRCDPPVGCVECLFDDDCAIGSRCQDRACVERRVCATDADCDAQSMLPFCDPIAGFCVTCANESQCGDNAHCVEHACREIQPCVNSLDCGEDRVCDRTLGECVGCLSDADCGDEQLCVNDVCEDRCTSDKQCVRDARLCHPALGFCSECVLHSDCPELYHCDTGFCELDVCQVDEAKCNETATAILTCDAVGSDFVASSCPAESTCVEGNDGPVCEPWLCSPNAVFCSNDWTSVLTCGADGQEVIAESPCPENEACESGACAPVICTPGEAECNGSTLSQCNPSGTVLGTVDTCGGGEYCDAASVQCKPRVCTPNAPACDGNLATTCNALGNGYAGEATDCGSQVCSSGSCYDLVCDPGSTRCRNDSTVDVCSANGLSWQYQEGCSYTQLCHETSGDAACLDVVCAPGEPACDDDRATTCSADGTTFEAGGTVCTSDEACFKGACLPTICEPSSYFCDGGDLFTCDSLGLSSALRDTCSAAEYCQDDYPSCRPDVCTALAPVCDGNRLTTCKADGSGPEPTGGQDCTDTNQACRAGACYDIICTPGERFCEGGNVRLCDATGTTTSLYDGCYSYEYCDADADPATCAPDVCTGSELGCLTGEIRGMCVADGSGFEAYPLDGSQICGAAEVCTLGGCAAQAVDETTPYDSWTSSYTQLHGNYYEIEVSRKLVEIENEFNFTGTNLFTWLVYESTSQSGPYTRIFERTNSYATQDTNAFFGSGAIDVDLVAGRYYLIGVQAHGAHYYYYDYSSQPQRMSFGRSIAGESISISTTPTTLSYGADTRSYRQRLTTERP